MRKKETAPLLLETEPEVRGWKKRQNGPVSTWETGPFLKWQNRAGLYTGRVMGVVLREREREREREARTGPERSKPTLPGLFITLLFRAVIFMLLPLSYNQKSPQIDTSKNEYSARVFCALCGVVWWCIRHLPTDILQSVRRT